MIRFSKTYPSFLTVKEGIILPLRLSCKESSTFLTKPLFNSLYDPFGSPSRGQKPQGREDVTALQCYICPTCPSPTGGSLPYTQALNPYHRDQGCNRPTVLIFLNPSVSLQPKGAPPFSPSLSFLRNERMQLATLQLCQSFCIVSGACAHKGLPMIAYAIVLRLFVGWRIESISYENAYYKILLIVLWVKDC